MILYFNLKSYFCIDKEVYIMALKFGVLLLVAYDIISTMIVSNSDNFTDYIGFVLYN